VLLIMTNRTDTAAIDPALSVNEVLRRWPAAVAALNAFGVDTCCGGALSLSAAAEEAGVSAAELIAAIRAQGGEAAGRAACS
jgi:regulator of cell morphogenesis and NO signaling